MFILSYLQDHWNDIQINLVASLIFFPLEVLITALIVQRVIQSIENRKWRPARRNVALYVIRAHRHLFNSTKYVIDPDDHVDLQSHGFPPGTSQASADYWGKSQHLRPLPALIAHLKQIVEHNIVALDSSLHPLISDFLLASDKILESINHMIGAYNPTQTDIYSGFLPEIELKKMEEIYKVLSKRFPEILEDAEVQHFKQHHAAELIALYQKAARSNTRFDLIPRPIKA